MKIHQLILILLCCLLVSCSKAHAGWFSKSNTDQEHKQKVIQLEHQLQGQLKKVDQWELVAVILGVGCILLFVVGTAIGAKTRHAATTPA